MGHEVVRGQRVGVDLTEDFDGGLIVSLSGATAVRLEKVDRSAYDDALPIRARMDLVHFECYPWVMLHRRQLRAWRRARIQPSRMIHVRDRLHVHAIVKREREPSDVVALEQ